MTVEYLSKQKNKCQNKILYSLSLMLNTEVINEYNSRKQRNNVAAFYLPKVSRIQNLFCNGIFSSKIIK